MGFWKGAGMLAKAAWTHARIRTNEDDLGAQANEQN
ncbi:hypothetical protein LMG28614_02117 [Paraburkholderia ultramafica]|uniref:Uncharacterized protein n=1 Tax=Paraburkholderia ultramafica TaxID=1544867 RepID=A0A6S7B260_9BURK|nr:hypothetical protein LMG28614_02117 [Paraburkholderia ultramafica]